MPRGRTAEPTERTCACGCGQSFHSRENAAKFRPECRPRRRREYMRRYHGRTVGAGQRICPGCGVRWPRPPRAHGDALCPSCATERARAAGRRVQAEKRATARTGGPCATCGVRPSRPGLVQCAECAAAVVDRLRQRKQRFREEGRCVRCGRPPAPGRMRCEPCGAYHRKKALEGYHKLIADGRCPGCRRTLGEVGCRPAPNRDAAPICVRCQIRMKDYMLMWHWRRKERQGGQMPDGYKMPDQCTVEDLLDAPMHLMAPLDLLLAEEEALERGAVERVDGTLVVDPVPVPERMQRPRDWADVRRAVLSADPLCARCRREGRVVQATEVDHVVPLRDGGGTSWGTWSPSATCATW